MNAVSSTVFLTNSAAAYLRKEKVYSLFAFLLTVTSWCYHTNKHILFFKRIDKTMVYIYMVYGICLMSKKRICKTNIFHHIVICLCMFISATLYYYGRWAKCFCYNKEFGRHYHSLMHGFASVGHHCILSLT